MTGEAQAALVERLLALLDGERVTRVVPMFGGRSVMVEERLLVSALRDGGLLVRVAGDQHAALLGREGAAQAVMGAGRDMGPGWIEVAAEAIADDDALASWVDAALEHHRSAATARR